MERALTCCFTGHRPVKLPWGYDEDDPRCIALKRKISDVIDSLYCSGIRHFISGMAEGCDLYFAEAVIAYRTEHEDVTLEAAVPFRGQASRWSFSQRMRYDRLISLCDSVKCMQEEYSRSCMLIRNRYMVDRSSVLLAIYDQTPGGTRHTLDYAAKKNLEIIIIQT
ncbi:MAG: DUF1273 family protein [Oscillospiraceae bacterium]|nr:DUF1273 family protein [Oscillospiraceae bacterium]